MAFETGNTGKPKGAVHVKTKIKRTLGLDAEDQTIILETFLKGGGAAKLITEMKKLKGRHYVMAWQMVAEYFMPKQQRTVVETKETKTLTINHVLNGLPLEQKTALLEHMRQQQAQTDTETIPFEAVDGVGEEQAQPIEAQPVTPDKVAT